MRRSSAGLEDIADFHNLASAFHAAARGKHGRNDVEAFRRNLDHELSSLRADLLDGTLTLGDARSFRIRDPKPRIIHAPVFRERVLHHAIMAHAGPVLDRALVFDTYACRVGKGTLAAVRRVRDHAGRYFWYTQIDISGYFAHVDHKILSRLLTKKFKNSALLALFDEIIGAHQDGPGRGLPIGALTSQHFANYYLAGADRLLLEDSRVHGMVRYMDDLIWWTNGPTEAHATLAVLRGFLHETLRLTIKDSVRGGPCRHGIMFCGFRVRDGCLLLTRRRKRRYRLSRREAETAWHDGQIDSKSLQSAYASALALTVHADALAWRRAELRRFPVAVELECA